MDASANTSDVTAEPVTLRRVLRSYRGPRVARSVLEIAITVVPLVGLWALTWASLQAGYWLGLVLTIPAAAFLVRLFMIQHDCGHGSFFRSRRTNDWVGRIIGVATLTPYGFWRHSHAIHHKTHGNLDRPRVGGVDTLTVAEFHRLPRLQRLRYRVYRHPLVLFVIGPAYIFILDQRLPVGFMRAGWRPWLSTMGTNVAVLALYGGLAWLVGWSTFLLIQAPITLLAASLGVWLFYVQHQFENTYWERESEWRFDEAGLQGSSHYVLPGILRWFSANIGVHHVHHLCCTIPSYRLPEVLRDYPELTDVSRITLRQSLAAVRLALWDEEQRRLVSFREADARA